LVGQSPKVATDPKPPLKFLSRLSLPQRAVLQIFRLVIGPVQDGLPLSLAAGLITAFAVAFDLGHVAAHSIPTPDLPRILFWHSPAYIVAAIPLNRHSPDELWNG
jgi:hypothetical protein